MIAMAVVAACCALFGWARQKAQEKQALQRHMPTETCPEVSREGSCFDVDASQLVDP